MTLSADCIFCLIERQRQNLTQYEDEDAKARYMKEVLDTIVAAGETATAPVVIAQINEMHQRYFGKAYSFEELKRQYNSALLAREEELATRIAAAEDPLLAALKFARAGNYIDFGAMSHVDDDKLNRLLDGAEGETLDPAEYECLRADLAAAHRLAYLTDNCGEIVLDKLLIRVLRQTYPQIHISVVVRGEPVLNDATEEDAAFVGLDREAEVVGNGTRVAGTQLDMIGAGALERIRSADVILSKGQGNFETLHGCGLNVYYLFLCKCDWFVRRFRMQRHSGVFVNERNCPV